MERGVSIFGSARTAPDDPQYLAAQETARPAVDQGTNVVGGLYQVRLSQNDMYDIPNRRLLQHRLPGVGYFKIGALRAPLDPPYFFAQEGMIDELAYAARLDPYEFRKRNVSKPRWLGVLKAATDAAKWTPRGERIRQ